METVKTDTETKTEINTETKTKTETATFAFPDLFETYFEAVVRPGCQSVGSSIAHDFLFLSVPLSLPSSLPTSVPFSHLLTNAPFYNECRRAHSKCASRRVSFASSTKTHDGMLPLHRAFDHLVSRFFASQIGVPLMFPLPEAPPLSFFPGPIEPPSSIAAAVQIIFHDKELAAGNPTTLRGLLTLCEDLHARLAHQQLDNVVDTEEEEEEEEEDEDEEEEDKKEEDLVASTTLTFLNEDADSDVESAFFRTVCTDVCSKREKIKTDKTKNAATRAVAVLRGGGGTNAKLDSRHLAWMMQLIYLVRHAVYAFP
jgi:hypothetical protein